MDKSSHHNENLNSLNAETNGLNSEQIFQWAKDRFGDSLFSMSSFGVDSAVMFEVMKKANINIPVLTIDTGFWFEETYEFKKEMIKKYDLEVITCRSTEDTIAFVKKEKLWETYPELYHELVKLEPLRDVIKKKNIKALLSGIRGNQTKIRASKHTVHQGSDGEFRIHPLLKWNQEDIEEYISSQKIPRHPLFYKGYASVGDWTTTKKGSTRNESRRMMSEKMECGLHIDENGKLVPLKSLRQR